MKKKLKLLLFGVTAMGILFMVANSSAYWIDNIHIGSICATVYGARGTNQWNSYLHTEIQITRVVCECRNKPFNSLQGKAQHFVPTSYPITFDVDEKEVPQDRNGNYEVCLDISEVDATDAALAAGYDCRKNDNWHMLCEVDTAYAYYEVWYGRADTCEVGETEPDCTIDDSCDATFSNIDWDANTATIETTCVEE